METGTRSDPLAVFSGVDCIQLARYFVQSWMSWISKIYIWCVWLARSFHSSESQKILHIRIRFISFISSIFLFFFFATKNTRFVFLCAPLILWFHTPLFFNSQSTTNQMETGAITKQYSLYFLTAWLRSMYRVCVCVTLSLLRSIWELRESV